MQSRQTKLLRPAAFWPATPKFFFSSYQFAKKKFSTPRERGRGASLAAPEGRVFTSLLCTIDDRRDAPVGATNSAQNDSLVQ